MKISELQVGQGKVNIEAEVKELGESRVFNKFGRDIKVANAIVFDDSGEVKLTLWNQDIDRVKAGNKVKIINGYVNEFNGEKQLTTGKFGSMEVLGEEKKAEKKVEEEAEEPEDY